MDRVIFLNGKLLFFSILLSLSLFLFLLTIREHRFGKYSKKTSMKRQLREMSTHLSSGVGYTLGPRPLRLDGHLSMLRHTLTKPLMEKGESGIEDFIEQVDQYGLTREDVMEKMPLFEMELKNQAARGKSQNTTIQSKVKSKLTRSYNNRTGKIRQGVAMTSVMGLDKDKIEMVKKGKSKGDKKKKKKSGGKGKKRKK